MLPIQQVRRHLSLIEAVQFKEKKKIAVLLLGIVTLAVSAMACSKNPMVGGQEMYPTKDIIDNAVNSADHTTLAATVKAAGLVGTLKGPGPFTVFAPTNEAFAKLPAGTVDNLLKPENRLESFSRPQIQHDWRTRMFC